MLRIPPGCKLLWHASAAERCAFAYAEGGQTFVRAWPLPAHHRNYRHDGQTYDAIKFVSELIALCMAIDPIDLVLTFGVPSAMTMVFGRFA